MKARREQSRWVRAERLPTLEELAWLRSAEGRAVCAAMGGGEAADSPAAIARWRERLQPELVSAAWMQVTLRRSAEAKFSRAGEMLFDRVALEQATDEAIAMHKAKRFAGLGRVVDFCCGIGGDGLALAAGCSVLAVDWSRVRLAMAEHNAEVYGRRIEVREADAEFERPEADAIHIDPDRRASGRRRHAAEAASPNLETIERMVSRYGRAAIKMSPGADFDMLPFEAEVELISHHGECKQAVLWTGGFREVHRRATVVEVRSEKGEVRNALRASSIMSRKGESLGWPEVRTVKPGDWLYEPDAAVIRADLVGVLARAHELGPIDSRIAYLVGERLVDTPLMKPFQVIDQMEWSAKRARAWLMGHGVGSVDVKTRGFAARPEEVIRGLRLTGRTPAGSEGSGTQAVLFLTRLGERPTAILAERVMNPGQAQG